MPDIVARSRILVAGRSIRAAASTAAVAGWTFAAGIAAVSHIALAQSDPALDAKVTAFVDAFTQSAGVPLDPGADVVTELVDLNGDGMVEALVTLNSPSWCGSRGCSSFVLDLSGPSASSLGEFIAIEFGPLDSLTGSWRDISVNGHRQVYQGGQYGRP